NSRATPFRSAARPSRSASSPSANRWTYRSMIPAGAERDDPLNFVGGQQTSLSVDDVDMVGYFKLDGKASHAVGSFGFYGALFQGFVESAILPWLAGQNQRSDVRARGCHAASPCPAVALVSAGRVP